MADERWAMDDKEQEAVAAILRATPPSDVPADFLARVNARIDETAGWLGLADFRAWTFRLVPAAAALALIAILWPASQRTTPATNTGATPVSTFSPASSSDWQQDVAADALLDAALRPAGAVNVR